MLGDGQITVQGPFYDVGDSTFIVTGGTGNFAGVTGELMLHRRDKEGKEMDFKFRLNK
jgi:allene oxide cyclase